MQSRFATPEREDKGRILETSRRLQADVLSPWMSAIPVSVVVVNQFRQIVFCNESFRQLARRVSPEELMGLRPGEALSCINATIEEGGCGCSEFCAQCGAAIAIISSLRGNAECMECHLLRKDDLGESPLDLQVFTSPVSFEGTSFTLFTAIDISHEKRLRYLERLFYHKMINEAGGVATLGDMLEQGEAPPESLKLMGDCAASMLRDVMYHRDLTAAECGKLQSNFGNVELQPFLQKLIEECRSLPQAARLQVELSGECKEIVTDARLLHHVLRNMLYNALEAQAAEVAVSDTSSKPVQVCCEAAEESVVVSITNAGDIPQAIRLQLFKRYVSSKGADRGLGLWVMRLLGEKYLKGSLTFETGEGKTRFRLKLPVMPDLK